MILALEASEAERRWGVAPVARAAVASFPRKRLREGLERDGVVMVGLSGVSGGVDVLRIIFGGFVSACKKGGETELEKTSTGSIRNRRVLLPSRNVLKGC
jgi:hypothetical protein